MKHSYGVSLAIGIGSHSVNYHPTQVNTPHLNPSPIYSKRLVRQ